MLLLQLIILVGLLVCSKSSEWGAYNTVQNPAKMAFKSEATSTFNCPANDSDECEYLEESLDPLTKYFLLKKRRNNSNLVKYIHDTKRKPFGIRSCSCTTGFQILDLGRDYFPRHLHTAICKPSGCAENYSCVGKRYTIRVLKEKQIDDVDSPQMANLPETLRDFWSIDNVTVTVACECMP